MISEIIGYTCKHCNNVTLQSCVEITQHEKQCRYVKNCLRARSGKVTTKITVVKAKNQKCSLITDQFGSSRELEKRVQIGNEVYPLRNDVSTGPAAPSVSPSDYFSSQRFKFTMSFSNDHLLKPWEDFADTTACSVDEMISKDLKFYSDQLKTGNISVKAGELAIQRIFSYNPSSQPPKSWRSTKSRVESYLENFKLLTHTVPFPPEWNIPKEIPTVSVEVRDILDIVACILADPKLQTFNEFLLQTYRIPRKKSGESGGCDHIMSSSWATKSIEKIKKIDSNGILIPIILYEDGITVDSAGVRNIDSIVLTLGNYSKKARYRDISKFHVGFVPKILKSSMITNLLKEKFGKSKGAEMFKLFRLQIHRDMYRLILSSIKQVSQKGFTKSFEYLNCL